MNDAAEAATAIAVAAVAKQQQPLETSIKAVTSKTVDTNRSCKLKLWQ